MNTVEAADMVNREARTVGRLANSLNHLVGRIEAGELTIVATRLSRKLLNELDFYDGKFRSGNIARRAYRPVC